jgi:hypothetical protein
VPGANDPVLTLGAWATEPGLLSTHDIHPQPSLRNGTKTEMKLAHEISPPEPLRALFTGLQLFLTSEGRYFHNVVNFFCD